MSKITYNKESKILTIRFSNKKSVDSDIKRNIVIDYDKNGEIVKIDIMRVSLEEFKRSKALRDFISAPGKFALAH